jgi:hypothetical protein
MTDDNWGDTGKGDSYTEFENSPQLQQEGNHEDSVLTQYE